MECHQKSFLQRTGKRPTLENLRNFFPGTVTDRVVRDWLSNNPEEHLGEMPGMVLETIIREQKLIEESGKRVKWKDDSDRDQVIRECQEAVREIEPYLVKYVLPYDYDVDFKFSAPLKAQHPVTGEPEDIVLIGYMDIIVRRDDGSWYVFDVKHTKDEYYWKKTVGQLMFYDLAVDIMFESPTSGVGLMQPLCKEKLKPFTLTEEDRTYLLKQVLDMANDIWLNETTPSPSPACSICSVKHACSVFKPVPRKEGGKRVSLL